MEKTIRHTILRSERLKSKKQIGGLFASGRSVKAYPLRFVWLEKGPGHANCATIQFSVSVPKRRFKKAVDRNRIKRQIRESYRLAKPGHLLNMPKGRFFILMILYMSPEKLPFEKIDKAMKKGFQKWIQEINSSERIPLDKPTSETS